MFVIIFLEEIFKDQQIKSGNPDSASFSMNEVSIIIITIESRQFPT